MQAKYWYRNLLSVGHVNILIQSFIQDGSTDDHFCYCVGVTVGAGTSVLQVTSALLHDRARDADTGTSVGHPRGEGVEGGGFMKTGQTSFVVLSSRRVVVGDVFVVTSGKLADCIVDVSVEGEINWQCLKRPCTYAGKKVVDHNLLDASNTPHFVSTVVTMGSSSVPVSRDGLRVKGDDDTAVFGNTVKDVASHPQIVSHLNSLTWTHLELPLKTNTQVLKQAFDGSDMVLWTLLFNI